MASVFVPLNRFQSVVTNLTGEQDQIYITPTGVSSIVLSAQITNNSYDIQPVTIFVIIPRCLILTGGLIQIGIWNRKVQISI
mgnify:CR=1 FL=1